MTDQSDILSGDATATTQQAPETVVPQATPSTAPSVDTFEQQLAAIKNEDGLQKYANVNDALTGAGHAQEFIKTLKDEAAEREETLRHLEEELANARAQQASAYQAPATQPAGLSREDVYSVMKDVESTKIRQSNRKSVIDTLVNHCNGDKVKASELIEQRLAAVGLTRDQLAALSESSPKAVYELMQIDGKGTSSMSKATSGTIRSDAVEMSNSGNGIPKAKRLPIGAGSAELVSEWNAAKAEVNHKLGM